MSLTAVRSSIIACLKAYTGEINKRTSRRRKSTFWVERVTHTRCVWRFFDGGVLGFLGALGRPRTLTFMRVQGASWDLISLAFYRDLVHFAEARKTSPEEQEHAAKAAGFQSPAHVGPYMRSLILYHADTMGPMLK